MSVQVTAEKAQVLFEDVAHQGEVLARLNGEVIFVGFGIPGEEALVEIRRHKKGYAYARLLEVVSPSPHRIEPRCEHYRECGGCQWQHVDYGHQLELKRRVVQEQMRRIGKLPDVPVLPTLPAPDPWHYRNHARFTVWRSSGKLGFVQRYTHRFLPIDFCHLMHPQVNLLLAELQGKCRETTQLSIRVGTGTGQYLIQPALKSTEIAVPTGQRFYEEELSGVRFRISAPSFFQVNSAQAERLADVVREQLRLSGDETLLDAYAGVGAFALLLASSAKKVIAIEESLPALKDAAVSAAGVENVEFLQGKVEELLPKLAVKPDAVILDPPRAGCHSDVISVLREQRLSRIVYVSCDPATLARDLALFCKGGTYQVEQVQPVDMFPQTYHIECVATLANEK
ncbi:MAG: 23S rRNA (uracil(1939)-C(5))-methyltransferase RlmD [Chloroflexi bacterium]|nr:23S rRNA (uracil(1939)-C(5))-methyltransferase RlmD [Chloroflexota bacterium]